MRADRLVSVLLFLQQRGQVTAAQVADELEVSTRTARRDLEALAVAGVPVYSRAGRGGGWSLVGGARTDLSGLTDDEARALFLVAGPASSGDPEVRMALRKLLSALPEPFQPMASSASRAVLVDPSGWGRSPVPRTEHLDALERAVVDQHKVILGYATPDKAPSTRLVDPLGLVAKGSVWYLVAGTAAGPRVFRLDRVRSAETTSDPAVRPADFDLAEAWGEIAAHIDGFRNQVRAKALVERSSLGLIRTVAGDRLIDYGPAEMSPDDNEADGHHAVEITGRSVGELAGMLAGFGRVITVIDPPEVRDELARIGRELTSTYAT